ncbi:MAG TPA: hypothetical protein DEO93_06860 [Stenotrophomonas sp.]|nr:hypothetical protein [Stenotrophomonas sp.]
MLRIAWQGDTRTKQLRQALERGLYAWAEAWFSGASCEIAAQDSELPDPGGCARRSWHATVAGGGTLWLMADDDLLRSVGARALGLASNSNATLLEEVGARCIAALVDALFGNEQPAPALVDGAPASSPAAFRLRHGGYRVSIDGVPGNLMVAVDLDWCAARLSPLAPAALPALLASRRSALASTRVTLDAAIALGSIELLDSLQLRVGEVLLTDVSSRPPVILSTASGRVGSGRIGPDARFRTVVLD